MNELTNNDLKLTCFSDTHMLFFMYLTVVQLSHVAGLLTFLFVVSTLYDPGLLF